MSSSKSRNVGNVKKSKNSRNDEQESHENNKICRRRSRQFGTTLNNNNYGILSTDDEDFSLLEEQKMNYFVQRQSEPVSKKSRLSDFDENTRFSFPCIIGVGSGVNGLVSDSATVIASRGTEEDVALYTAIDTAQTASTDDAPCDFVSLSSCDDILQRDHYYNVTPNAPRNNKRSNQQATQSSPSHRPPHPHPPTFARTQSLFTNCDYGTENHHRTSLSSQLSCQTLQVTHDFTRRRELHATENCLLKLSLMEQLSSVTVAATSAAASSLSEQHIDDCIFARDNFQLAGDSLTQNSLPISRQSEVNFVSVDTVAKLLTEERHRFITPEDFKSISCEQNFLSRNSFSASENLVSFLLLDCRYAFEFNGGHISAAHNVQTIVDLNVILDRVRPSVDEKRKVVLIFHCEFSSHRAPTMARQLRNEDRKCNFHRYPFLYFPEIYVIEGGYRDFYSQRPNLCIPVAYVSMFDSQYREELRLAKLEITKKTSKRR